jgi:hypothetical protein
LDLRLIEKDVRDARMISPEQALAQGEGLGKVSCCFMIVEVMIHEGVGEVVQGSGDVEVVGAEELSAELEGPPVPASGVYEVAGGEGVQAAGLEEIRV